MAVPCALPAATGTSIEGSGKRNRPRNPPRAVKNADNRRAFAPCVTAISIWYSHQEAPQSWIWDVPVKGERASATDVISLRSSEDTSVSGKTGMAISDHLTPAPPIGHAFLGDAGDFRDGRSQSRVDLFGHTHLCPTRVDVHGDARANAAAPTIVRRLAPVPA